jgi:sensor histidine kinase regulating citrate/malate metabolism
MKELAKKAMITFDVNTKGSMWVYKIPQTELIDVLSNLISNAFEEVEKLAPENRFVQLDFYDNTIEVRNHVSFDLIKSGIKTVPQFIERGYSTKGADRGFGMNNVIAITERYNIKTNYELSDGCFVFSLEFPE